MGRRGTKKAPTPVKLAMGTHRKDRDGDPDREPTAPIVVDCPPPPDSLGEAGRECWLSELPKIIAAGYFTQLDTRAFERFCRAHDEVAKCDAVLLEEGEHTNTESGYICQHPAVNQRFKWLDIIRRYETDFWMNPTARAGKQLAGQRKSTVPKRSRA